MITLSLDASSTCTGWCVLKNGQYVESGFIDLKKDKNTDHRIFEMAKQISELIEHYKPNKIILEDTYSSPNVSTLKLLANLAGAIKFYCYLHEFELETVYPSEWRKFLHIQEKGAKRNELKNKAFNVCIDQLGLTDVIEDQAEAICIGLSIAVRDGLFTLKEINDDNLWD